MNSNQYATEKDWCKNSSTVLQKGIPAQTFQRSSTANAGRSRRAPLMMKEDAECLLARSKVSGADYPPPNAASFDKERHRRTAEYRLREGVNSTKDSRAGYFKNRQDAQKANEVFILHGSNQSKFRKISDAVPPSQKGKNIDFYSLRDEMPKMHPLMPQKNKLSTSFAVDEDKIQRKRFSFP